MTTTKMKTSMTMKKKSIIHSASENASTPKAFASGAFQRFTDLTRRSHLRVLFSLFVMLAGVLLALVSFGPATTGFAQGTTREQMTVTLAQALNIQPPACVPGQEMFNDVPASSPFCPFIEELARRGVTGGCGGGNYCPGDPVTRAQMAVFLTKALGSEDVHLVGTAGEPPFQNGWHNIGSDHSEAGFFKDALGIVHLQGGILTPTANSGSTAFTLPQGYRPAKILFLPIAGSGPIAANLGIAQDGQLTATCAGAPIVCAVGLDGLAFRVP
jgi:S-layer homology domain